MNEVRFSFCGTARTQLRRYAIGSAVFAAALTLLMQLTGRGYHTLPHIALRLAYLFCAALLALFLLNPRSTLYRRKTARDRLTLCVTAAAFLFTLFACTAPMCLNPFWSGHDLDSYHQEYQELAEALLEGHLNVHTDEDVSALLAMENPYDLSAREALGISYHWDHVFYNGKYYIYFGIVPVLVLFLPYRLLTGHALVSWVGAAVFAAFAVAALFALTYKLFQKLNARPPLAVAALLPSALCIVTLWYGVKYPELYCTANLSGLCFVLWSVYFLFDAFYFRAEAPLWEVAAGALCGALVFGCRPPIGLGELLFAPLIVDFIQERLRRKNYRSICSRALAFAVPYLTVAALLMLYNYVRFGNPLEFGQSYQLTSADQTSYTGSALARFSLWEWCKWCIKYFVIQGKPRFPNFRTVQKHFPFITMEMGLPVSFPLLWAGLMPWRTQEKRMKALHGTLFAGVGLIIAAQTISCPWLLKRYTMDFSYLLCLAVLFAVAFRYADTGETRGRLTVRRYTLLVCYAAALSMLAAFLLFFATGDYSLVDVDPARADALSRFFALQSLLR